MLQHAESARNDMQERLETTEAAIEALQQEMADHQADLSRRLSQLDTEETELVEVTAKQGTFAKEQQGLDRQRTALVNDVCGSQSRIGTTIPRGTSSSDACGPTRADARGTNDRFEGALGEDDVNRARS